MEVPWVLKKRINSFQWYRPGKNHANYTDFVITWPKSCQKKWPADVFGLDEWVKISRTLEYYMFSIIIENNSVDNYFTEKLLNCFAVGTVPIYLGCPNIGEFFNRNGIIEVSRKTNFKKLVHNLCST